MILHRENDQEIPSTSLPRPQLGAAQSFLPVGGSHASLAAGPYRREKRRRETRALHSVLHSVLLRARAALLLRERMHDRSRMRTSSKRSV